MGDKAERYVALEKFSAKASAAQATAGKVVFTLPYVPTGYIAQVAAPTTGVVNNTGLAVKIATDSTTGVITAEVAVTTLAENSIVSLICFK
jgi:hypothetical protein